MLKNSKTYLMISMLVGAVAMTAPVLAADTPTDAQATSKPASPSGIASDDSTLTTGTVVRSNTREQKLKDCMAIWEPATHMSKEQWKRTCNRQLDDEPRP
jgi:predicted DNA-binding protein (MmcQ/YjbR family)